jgi:hypothetical protein
METTTKKGIPYKALENKAIYSYTSKINRKPKGNN